MREFLSKSIAAGLSTGVVLLWWPVLFDRVDTVTSWLARGVAWTVLFELLLVALLPFELALWETDARRAGGRPPRRRPGEAPFRHAAAPAQPAQRARLDRRPLPRRAARDRPSPDAGARGHEPGPAAGQGGARDEGRQGRPARPGPACGALARPCQDLHRGPPLSASLSPSCFAKRRPPFRRRPPLQHRPRRRRRLDRHGFPRRQADAPWYRRIDPWKAAPIVIAAIFTIGLPDLAAAHGRPRRPHLPRRPVRPARASPSGTASGTAAITRPPTACCRPRSPGS